MVLASVITIVNYDHKTFIVQATAANFTLKEKMEKSLQVICA